MEKMIKYKHDDWHKFNLINSLSVNNINKGATDHKVYSNYSKLNDNKWMIVDWLNKDRH